MPGLPNHPSASSGNLVDTLRHAHAAFAGGDFSQAALCCKRVLAAQKKNFDALHLMGVIEFHRANLKEAGRLIRHAIKINPRSADAHTNYALVINGRKGPAEALASLERALTINPDHLIALNNRGNFLWRLKRPQDALASLDRALAMAPDYGDAHCNRGNVLCELERFEEAIASFNRAIAISPRDHLAWHNHGKALLHLERFEEAATSYRHSLEINPDDAFVLSDLGNVLKRLKRWDQALGVFDRLAILRPNDIDALRHRGECLLRLRRLTEALEINERAVAIRPDTADYLGDYANVLGDLGRFDEALANLEKALLLEPDNADQHWNRGLIRLRIADFDGGWQDYEWRLRKADNAPLLLPYTKPRWNGEQPLTGKTILLWAEQGLGDTIQFARYASLIARRAGRVILEVQPALKVLLVELDGVSQVISRGEDLPPHDYQCPLMSVPLALKTTLADLPPETRGLQIPSDRIAKWGNRLPASGAPRVAIAWAGNPDFIGDHSRSIGLPALSPLLDLSGIEFLSIQKALRPGDAEVLRRRPQVLHLGDEIEDFGDTAAIMSLVDLVISSDTSVVHLAGALGRMIWVLLSHPADWRWMLDRDDSPWYPSARLFRQRQTGAWTELVERVSAELAKRVPTVQ